MSRTSTAVHPPVPRNADRSDCVVVCEKSGQWAAVLRSAAVLRGAAELRTAACAQTLRLSETRAYAACLRELAAGGQRAVVLELRRDKLAAGLDALATIKRRFPATHVFVVAERTLQSLEWVAREVGATHFVTSPRDPAPLVALLRRALGKSSV